MSDTGQEYRGETITVRFDGSKCIHSRNCVMGLPKVFAANAPGPWIRPDEATAEEIAALAHGCPSGAISYERHDGGPAERAPDVNQVRVLENGPLAVHAELRIEGHEPAHRATLCRCGDSDNKPFCDGSHREAGFQATGEPPSQESEPLDDRGGPLDVKAFPNGPLKLVGNLEIIAGTGRTISRTTTTALCRCGHSQNKPFCDGSHTAAGFEAP